MANVTWTQRATEDFTGNTFVSMTDPPWQPLTGANGIARFGNVGRALVADTHNGMWWTTYAFKDIQYAEVDLGTVLPSRFNGLVLRWNGTRCFICEVQQSTNSFSVIRYTAGGSTTNCVPPFSGTYTGGASRLRFEAIGGTLNVYRNGTLVGTSIDTLAPLITAGRAGIYTTGNDIDNFAAGDGDLSARRHRHRGGELWGIIPEVASYLG